MLVALAVHHDEAPQPLAAALRLQILELPEGQVEHAPLA
jgi:hypothetical protein